MVRVTEASAGSGVLVPSSWEVRITSLPSGPRPRTWAPTVDTALMPTATATAVASSHASA